MTQQALREPAQKDDEHDVTDIEGRLTRLETRLDNHIKLAEQMERFIDANRRNIEELTRIFAGDPNAINPNGMIATVRQLSDAVTKLQKAVDDERQAREQRTALMRWVFGSNLASAMAALSVIAGIAGGVFTVAKLVGLIK